MVILGLVFFLLISDIISEFVRGEINEWFWNSEPVWYHIGQPLLLVHHQDSFDRVEIDRQCTVILSKLVLLPKVHRVKDSPCLGQNFWVPGQMEHGLSSEVYGLSLPPSVNEIFGEALEFRIL